MGKLIRAGWRFVVERWERVLFGLVGLACLGFSFRFLYLENIASASAVFAIAFFSFLYSNLARFKKFKGLGFEAELWEDKQKEAADLIDRLKSVVGIYTEEVVMSRVLQGRMGGSVDWKSRWALYDELVVQHAALGQTIDFSNLKRKIDGALLFDICLPLLSNLEKNLSTAKAEINKQISAKYGKPISDISGYNADLQKLRSAEISIEDKFGRSERYNLAQEILDKMRASSEALQDHFSVSVAFDPKVVNRLERVAVLAAQRPLAITDELIEWGDDHKLSKLLEQGDSNSEALSSISA